MNIKGNRFGQKKLQSNFTGFVAGQSLLTKFTLALLIVLLYGCLSFVGSYQGGGVILPIILETPYKATFSLVFFITLIWLFSTVIWDWQKGINMSISSAFIGIVLLQIVSYLRLLQLGSDFLIVSIGNLIVQLSICGVLFFAFRFLIALSKILFLHSRFFQLLTLLLSCSIAIPTSLLVFSIGLQRPEFVSQENLASISSIDLLRLKITTVLGGLGLVLSLMISAWFTNQRRQVPWNYPDLLRELALVIGTWGGTSFHGLVLSNANFTRSELANTDLRAKKLYRTCFQDVAGLERARVDNQYLDLAYPKVQKLLTHGCSLDPNFSKFNLQGAYLQNADMRGFDLTDTNLTGSDLKGADLRGSRLIRTQLAGADLEGVDLRTNILIDANLTEANLRGTDLRDCILVRAQVARADFTGADLTGACIEDWSVSDKTTFTDVRCDYVFKEYEDGQPIHRYPSDRNFEPGEFAALFQQPENELELIFKGDFSYSALSLAFYKLKTEKSDLELDLKGIEQRGNLWVVRVTSSNPTIEAQLEQQFSEVYQTTTNNDSIETTIKDSIYRDYEDIKQRLVESQQLVRQFAGISESQAEALKQLSKQAFGTNFYIEGSAITNLSGQGIQYTEAAGQIRSLVTRSGTEAQISQGSQQVLTQLQAIATTPTMQTELIQQILLREAQDDPAFRRILLQQQQQILTALPPGTIASAIRGAIAQLHEEWS
ncbi:pentapeptide repeat-containing protein [Egbenema bharatensis]|uniref:pentapeptide repeat-containing protein n=1 Tax=Egbenema bharatensis TaxID=3463334 RepID=UPI003A8BAE62